MVFKKQENPKGDYVTKDQEIIDEEGHTVIIPGGDRYEILFCERTESMEWYDTGRVDEYGNPIYEQRVVINKGWDAFPIIEAAAEAYGLIYDPLPIEEELDNEETVG